MRKISMLLIAAAVALSACQQSFKKGDEGVEYKIISSGKGDQVKYGNFIQMQVKQLYANGKEDSVIMDTRTSPQGSAFEILDSMNMPMTYFKILRQLRKGDSLVVRILVDSAFKQSPQGIPPMFKKGHYLLTTAKVENIFATREQADSARKMAMELGIENQKKADAEQLKKDDKTLQEYFAKNNIKPVKTANAVYVQIITPGTGPNADTSSVVKVNYTGRLLGGKTFDSNTDPAFNHVEPLLANFTNDPMLGVSVIPGWVEGMKLLNEGAKAKLFIPSPLGYGAQGAGPDIKPNSILVFDVEILDILTRSEAMAAQQAQQKKMEEMQKHFMDSLKKVTPTDTSRK